MYFQISRAGKRGKEGKVAGMGKNDLLGL